MAVVWLVRACTRCGADDRVCVDAGGGNVEEMYVSFLGVGYLLIHSFRKGIVGK